MATTLIRNADFVTAWNAGEKNHLYMPGADVVFDDGVIRFVGRGFDGMADTVVDGAGFMVMPGLVDIHSHPSSEPMNKGLIDEVGSPGLYHSSLYEYLPIFRADADAVPRLRACRNERVAAVRRHHDCGPVDGEPRLA